jgi:hypothetical protein
MFKSGIMRKIKDPSGIKIISPKKAGLFEKEDLTFRIIEILDKGKDLGWSLQQVCDAVTAASTIENAVFARISFNNQIFRSHPFEETSVEVKHDFRLSDNKRDFSNCFFHLKV